LPSDYTGSWNQESQIYRYRQNTQRDEYMKKSIYKGIELNRWEKGIEHDSRSVKIAKTVGEIDFDVLEDSLCLSFGGDGDNGEALMYALDIYFELLDKKRI
jgi:hypothetical protein